MRRAAQEKKNLLINIRGFVTCMCAIQFVQTMISGYNKSVFTSIERRYQLDTSKIGLLQSSFHIGNLSIVLFVTYFGSRWHRPRSIAIGCLAMSFSTFISFLPQVIGGRYDPKRSDIVVNLKSYHNHPDQAKGNVSMKFEKKLPHYKLRDDFEAEMSFCAGQDSIKLVRNASDYPLTTLKDSNRNSMLYVLLVIGSLLKGFGHSPIHPLGMSYIDDFSSQKNSPLYIGILSGFSLLGPGFGFLLGSFTTSLWVDTGWENGTIYSLHYHSSMWVGAWWLGYLIISFLLLFVAVPMFFFPREILKETKNETEICCDSPHLILSKYFRRKLKNENSELSLDLELFNSTEQNSNSISKTENHCKKSSRKRNCMMLMKDFFYSFVKLLVNPLVLTLISAHICISSFLSTSVTYSSKYLESEFDLSATTANLINGAVNLPIAVVGTVCVGMYMRIKNSSIRSALHIILFSLSIAVAVIVVALLIGCEGPRIVGVNTNENQFSCFSACDCFPAYQPVCDVSRKTTYKSACFAGCLGVIVKEDKKLFLNCSCIGGDVVTDGLCNDESCSKTLVYYVIMMAIIIMFVGMAATSSTVVILRAVPHNEKAFAVGILVIFTRLLGWIPTPIYVGRLIDGSCMLRSTVSDDIRTGYCQVYNKTSLRHRIFSTALVQLLFALVIYSLSYYVTTRRYSHTDSSSETKCRRNDNSL